MAASADVAPIEPQVQMMVDPQLESVFGNATGLLVKQTMRGCLQECLGCEAKSEFTMSHMEWADLDTYRISAEAMARPDVAYALEESGFCCRLCWRDGRPFDMVVSLGGAAGGPELFHNVKPCGFPLNCSIPTNDGSIDFPCCCLLPKVDTVLPNGQPLGSQSQYICDQNLFVPKLEYRENGQAVYVVKPETCFGGCCIACNCKGKGCLWTPYYFHDPATGQPIGGAYDQPGTPQIRKVWAGMKKECCSTADNFAVMFPQGIDANRKAGLLGMTFLLDFTVFERQNDHD